MVVSSRPSSIFKPVSWLFFALILITPLTSIAEDFSVKTFRDWDRIFDACDENWDQYETDLNRLRTTVKREVDQMSEQQYTERWRAKDPLIGFVRIHWPSIFASKDPGWQFYQKCADLNWKVRKSLSSAAETKVEKQKQIGLLKSCLAGIFSRNQTVPPPFDRLVSCYTKKAKN